MLKVSSCPSVEEWTRFLSGELPQNMHDLLAAHIAACSGCLEKVRCVSMSDAFVRSIGKARELPEGPDSEVISRLIDKIKSMKNTDASDATVDLNASDSVPSVGESGEHDDEATDFLAPAQAAGEIGRLGPYRVLDILGRGGMGVVFRAEDVALKRVVALKAMLPGLAASSTAKKRFLREAQTAANIKHDHIVTIFQVSEDRGVPFMAMEYLHGETLEARLQRDRKLPTADVIRIGREIGEGLAAAHENGLIHRDIKPANIWLEKPGRGQTLGRVKILDFGLARSADADSDLTQRGTIIGTPAYMAPEQTSGGPIDSRADLFSLGCVMYLMATGQTPFRGKDSISTIMAVANDAAVSPRTINADVPAELSECIMRLLAKKPGDRPASADDVVARLTSLQSVRAGAPESASPQPVGARPSTLPQSPRGVRRWPLVAALAGFAALVALGAVFFLPTPHGTIRVEVNDDDIEVVLTKTGVKIKTGAKQGDIVVAPGEYSLKVIRGDLDFETDKFQLKRGETVAVKLTFLKDKLQAAIEGGRPIGSKVAATPGPAGEKARNGLRLACGEYATSEPVPKLDSVVTTYEVWVSQFNTADKADERLLSGPHATLGFRGGKTEFYTVHAEVAVEGFPPKNQLVHLAGVNDGKERRLYINGKLAATLDNPGNLDPNRDPAPIVLGQRGDHIGEHIVSTIAQARISRVARYTKDFVPAQEFASDADTIALYRFTEGKGDVVKDSSGNGHHLKIQGAKWVKLATNEVVQTRWTPSKEQQAFFDAVARLPEKSRCETVARMLTDLNRGRHGLPAVAPMFQPLEGPPTSCTVSESFAAILWPLAALTSLEKLDISACSPTDYGWLTRLPLVELKAPLVVDNLAGERALGSMPTLRTVNDQPVSKFFANRAEIRKEIDSMADKAPTLPLADRAAWLGTMIKKIHPETTAGVVFSPENVTGVWLHEDIRGFVADLHVTDDHFYDISPLRALGLDAVQIGSKCRVFDLSPLSKTKITHFRVYDNLSLRDISPLTGTPIKSLEINESMIGDLNPLKKTRIEDLTLIFGSPYDETCLRGLPLNRLIFMGGSIKDLSVLKGAPLTRLSLRSTQVSDLAPLEGMKIEYLDLHGCAVTDLTPVLKMPLKELILPLTISDLAPLRGIPLVNLEFNGQAVTDLSPLKGMPLTRLSCLGGAATDLTPIRDMPIRALDITFVPERDAAVLRSLTMLESINGQPAKGIIDKLP